MDIFLQTVFRHGIKIFFRHSFFRKEETFSKLVPSSYDQFSQFVAKCQSLSETNYGYLRQKCFFSVAVFFYFSDHSLLNSGYQERQIRDNYGPFSIQPKRKSFHHSKQIYRIGDNS